MRSVALILFVSLSVSVHAQPPPASSKLLEQCEAGIAKACFNYSLYLRNQRDPRGKELASVYMRRACSMAYAPACAQRSQPNETVAPEEPDADLEELVAERNKVKATIDQLQGRFANSQAGKKMSVVERMGFRATPLLLKIFGADAFAFTSSGSSAQ